ncbi:MAG: permease, partial [Elusimicrobia bacterium]|nr:permease [Elusimicrobiota bacterium]
TCLVPAFFVAGAVSVFVRQAAVMRYFGPRADKRLSYGVASVSGTLLAVCSCTVLPLYAGIAERGAGIGPAVAFLYSGPAINVLAIVLTARVLGLELGAARAVGAVAFSVVIGLLMAALFERGEPPAGTDEAAFEGDGSAPPRTLRQEAAFFLGLVAVMVLASWGRPESPVGFFDAVYRVHWPLAAASLAAVAWMAARWFEREELRAWVEASWGFAKEIFPLLLGGVFAAGVLMGRPGRDSGLIPSALVARAVGGDSIRANLLSSGSGALMYFATLTEVPILQTLLGSGMGKGPALALLLAGPSLSLPSMVVLSRVMGTRRLLAYAGLVVGLSAAAGLLYGMLA